VFIAFSCYVGIKFVTFFNYEMVYKTSEFAELAENPASDSF
jgi:hypothetical protein